MRVVIDDGQLDIPESVVLLEIRVSPLETNDDLAGLTYYFKCKVCGTEYDTMDRAKIMKLDRGSKEGQVDFTCQKCLETKQQKKDRKQANHTHEKQKSLVDL